MTVDTETKNCMSISRANGKTIYLQLALRGITRKKLPKKASQPSNKTLWKANINNMPACLEVFQCFDAGLNKPSTLTMIVKKHLIPPSMSDPNLNIWQNKRLLLGPLHRKHFY